MNNCLRSHLLTRDNLLCDIKCYTIFPQRFERNHLKDQWLCIVVVINSYHSTIFYSHKKSNYWRLKKMPLCLYKKKGCSNILFFQNHIHNFVKCMYCRGTKKGREFLNNVIRSMWSISIDHMGFFTCALTSIVFDHICWHETNFKRGKVNCAHCIFKKRATLSMRM